MAPQKSKLMSDHPNVLIDHIREVERLAAAGSLAPRSVKIPGVLVDHVVLADPAPRKNPIWLRAARFQEINALLT